MTIISVTKVIILHFSKCCKLFSKSPPWYPLPFRLSSQCHCVERPSFTKECIFAGIGSKMFAVCGGFHFPRVSRQSASDHFAFCAFIFVYLFICICVFVYLYLFICLFVFMYLCICIHRGFHSSRVSQQSAPLHLSFCQNGVFFTATSSVTTKSLFETKFVNLKASDNSYGILCLQCFRKYHLIII